MLAWVVKVALESCSVQRQLQVPLYLCANNVIFSVFFLYIIYHISFHFILSLPPFHESTKLYFSASAHIFFSSYLYFQLISYKVANFIWRHILEDYWGSVFDPSEVSITVTLLNHRLHHVVVCRYACQFYNLFIFLSWSNAVLSFVTENNLIHKFFIFPFLVLTLQCTDYVWGPVSQITGSTAVRDVQMDGLWSHPSLLLLQRVITTNESIL